MKMETNTIQFKVVRRTSKYNKYIKWFAETYRDDGSLLSSAGYKTEREARESLKNRNTYLNIGDRVVLTQYQEVVT